MWYKFEIIKEEKITMAKTLILLICVIDRYNCSKTDCMTDSQLILYSTKPFVQLNY
jgi:hypothetical protein